MKTMHKHERGCFISIFSNSREETSRNKKPIQMADQIDDVTREDTGLADDIRRKERADHTS